MSLRISPNLVLSIEAVTETFAILAKRGAGKTYTAAVLIEEMAKAGFHVCIVDPIGVWWGLRSSADGKGPGISIVVIGGDHGDVPLEETAGELIADLVVDGASVVIDLSLLRKKAQTRFMTDFAERLYHRNREPLHLVLDEADAFAPQKPMSGQERLLGAIEDLVRRGRARGIGVTLVTQRSAVLNKDVLTQAQILVALRTIHPRDRQAIEEWVKAHGTPEERDQLMESLASLPIGEAWFWNPGEFFKRVKVRRRETFDSSSTPKVGTKRVEPKKRADVDLEQLRTRMAATIERAKADDPKELRKRITDLNAQLTKAQAQKPEPQRVEIPVLQSGEIVALQSCIDELRAAADGFGSRLVTAADKIAAALNGSAKPHGAWGSGATPTYPALEHVHNYDFQPPCNVVKRSAPQISSGPGEEGVPKMHRAMLTALAQHPQGLSKGQVLLHTGYASSGPVSKAFAELARQDWISGDRSEVRITDAGIRALGSYEPLPAGGELRQQLLSGSKLSTMEKALLKAICASYPRSISKGQVLEQAGYASSGPVSAAFARLVRYGYAVAAGRAELVASDVLFD